MVNHSSATPHVSKSTNHTISNALRRRAQSLIKDRSIDAQSRAIIRYGLETNDPYLAELLRRADAGENIIDTFDFSQTPAQGQDDSSKQKLEALTEMICGAGEEPAAALLVLMATFQDSIDPKALANTAKHLAFTRCGELNLYGMVDAQIAVLEGEVLAGKDA